MTDCLFCKMVDGTIPTTKLYEDSHLFVIKDIRPKARVHLLVIPKIHIDSLLEVDEQHADLLGHMTVSLKKFAKDQGLSSFRTIVNAGKGSGQEIFHLHYHILGGANLSGF